jgi:hypothetical protein
MGPPLTVKRFFSQTLSPFVFGLSDVLKIADGALGGGVFISMVMFISVAGSGSIET